MYERHLTTALSIQNATADHAQAMAVLQKRVFPTLSATELLTADHFAEHIRLFRRGQFVALLNGEVIGSTSTFRTRFPNSQHTFLEVTGNLSLSTHDESGDWLYGFDLGVDPDFRGLGLGRLLYRARSEMALRLGLKGQVIVGMPSGFGKVMEKMSFDNYYKQIISKAVFDPTVSMQMKMGFSPCGIIPEYLEDPKCGNFGVMMTLPADQNVDEPKMNGDQIAAKIAESLAVRHSSDSLLVAAH